MTAFLQCSILNVQFSMNGQWSMVNDKLLKIDNWKLIIAAPKGGACG